MNVLRESKKLYSIGGKALIHPTIVVRLFKPPATSNVIPTIFAPRLALRFETDHGPLTRKRIDSPKSPDNTLSSTKLMSECNRSDRSQVEPEIEKVPVMPVKSASRSLTRLAGKVSGNFEQPTSTQEQTVNSHLRKRPEKNIPKRTLSKKSRDSKAKTKDFQKTPTVNINKVVTCSRPTDSPTKNVKEHEIVREKTIPTSEKNDPNMDLEPPTPVTNSCENDRLRGKPQYLILCQILKLINGLQDSFYNGDFRESILSISIGLLIGAIVSMYIMLYGFGFELLVLIYSIFLIV